MAPPLRFPSTLEHIDFPVLASAWHASKPSLTPSPSDCNVFAYCGGGGSAANGVENSIRIIVRTLTEEGHEKKRIGKIDTGKDVGFAIALFQPFKDDSTRAPEVWLLAALQEDIFLYSASLLTTPNDLDIDEVARQPLDSLVNSVAFAPLGTAVVAGCENGLVLVYNLLKGREFQKHARLEGHERAVCTVVFHPRDPHIILSSAKDGTCRVWDCASEGTLVDVLQCSVVEDNPNKKASALALKEKRTTNMKLGQVLVKSCAFGDLEGKIVYTVASGRRYSSFLTRWHMVIQQPLSTVPPPPGVSQRQQQQQARPIIKFQPRVHRLIASNPVSAMSLSGDASLLALGDTDGTVTLVSTETMMPIKLFENVHDLPVTSIAARPAALGYLTGESSTGIKVDAISTSADNRLALLTLQKKSLLKKTRQKRVGNEHSLLFYLLNVWLWTMVFLLMKVSFETCEDQILSGEGRDAWECVFHTVLWAEHSRPGIAMVPH